MADNTPLIPTEPDWDGTPLSRTEEILYSIIHSEEWDGTPLSRGEYLLLQVKDTIENNSMLDIKGRVDSVEDLPTTGNKKGDVYAVGPEDQLNKPEYYWDGDSWEYLGQLVDLSGYLPLTGGTMTGAIDFNLGSNRVFEIGAYGGDARLKSPSGMEVEAFGVIVNTDSSLVLGRKNVTGKAFKHSGNVNNLSTEIWGNNSTLEGTTSVTVLNRTAGVTPETVNSIDMSTISTPGFTMQANHGFRANFANTESSINSTNGKLTVQTNNAAMDIKTDGGSILMQANGGQNHTLTIDGVGVPVTVQSTGTVTIRSPYANGSVGISQGPSGQTSSVNLYGGSVNMNATGSVVATATTAVVANVGSGMAAFVGTDLVVNQVPILSTLSSIQTTIGNINTVLEEVL